MYNYSPYSSSPNKMDEIEESSYYKQPSDYNPNESIVLFSNLANSKRMVVGGSLTKNKNITNM